MNPRSALPLAAAAWSLAPFAATIGRSSPQVCHTSYLGGWPGQTPSLGGLEVSLSADGQRLLYLERVPGYQAIVHDRVGGTKALVSSLADGTALSGGAFSVSLSADGRHASFFSASVNGGSPALQVYVKHLDGGALEIATLDLAGQPMSATGVLPGLGKQALSGQGERVVFVSDSKELTPNKTSVWRDVFVRDLPTQTTARIMGFGGAEPNLPALTEPAISADARFVAFASRASNMVPSDSNGRDDVFVHDLGSGTTQRVSLSSGGAQANHDSLDPVISADGRFVAFASRASNLVPGDTNNFHDVFVRDRATGTTQRASVGPSGLQADGHSSAIPRLSAGGQRVLFHSQATNLVGGAVSAGRLYVRDLVAGTTQLAVESASSPGENDWCALSGDGHHVGFASLMPFGPLDTNDFFDVFVTSCKPSAPASICPVTPNGLGCLESIQSSGLPSASAGSGFLLSTQNTVSQQLGLLRYSIGGFDLETFGPDFACLAAPVTRSQLLHSGGSVTPDCSGSLALDFNALVPADASLVAGTIVWAQFHSRDPLAASGGHHSNALTFALAP